MKQKLNFNKKIVFMVCFFLFLLGYDIVYAATSSKIQFCNYGGVRRTFMLIGICINLIKVIIPLLISGVAMVSFFKTVTSGKFDDLKATILQLVKQLVAGLIIFCLPALLDFVFESLVGYDDSGFTICTNCLFNPDKCTIPDEDPVTYTKN